MRKWWALVAICLGTFLLLVDVTIVNVALPDISRSLGSSMASLQWTVDAYALALAALLLTAGSAADLMGRRRIYLVGLIVFASASLLCGLAPNDGVLIAGRAIQGIGGAAMFSTTTALLTSVYAGRERAIAFSAWAAVSASAAAVGPVLGGALTRGWGWPAIFLVNVPIVGLTLLLARRVLPESRASAGKRFDVVGALSFTTAAGSIVAGLIQSAQSGWGDPLVTALLSIGASAIVVFAVAGVRVTKPMLDARLFRRPAFTGLMLAAVVLQGATFAHLSYTSLWLQSSLRMDPLIAGLVLTPLSLSALVIAAFAGRILHMLPPRIPIGVGLVVIGVGVLTEALIEPSSTWMVLLAGMILSGVGAGMATAPLVSAALSAVPPAEAGTASGAVNTFRQLGQAIGVAVLGSVFVSSAGETLAENGVPKQAAAALGAGQSRRVADNLAPADHLAVADMLNAAFTSGLHLVFLTAGLAAVSAGIVSWFLIGRGAGAVPETPLNTSTTTKERS